MATQRNWDNDPYTQKAQREGYAARSAYKLLEIQRKWKILPRGGRALDLGCAPGAWLQVAAQVVGRKGSVVGIDLKPAEVSPGPNVRSIVGDAFATDAATLLDGGPLFHAVLSDMAPNTTGDPTGDHFESVHLCDRVLELLPEVLKPSGNCTMKVFEGEAYPDLLARTRQMFQTAKGFKPKASRERSREIFVVATGYKGTESAQQLRRI